MSVNPNSLLKGPTLVKTVQDVDDSRGNDEAGSDLTVIMAVLAAVNMPLSPTLRFVLLAVAAHETLDNDRARADDGNPFPATALEVSLYTGLSVSEADSALTELRRGGYLFVRGWVNVGALMPFLPGRSTS